MNLAEAQVTERLNSENNLANKFGKGNRKNHENAGRKEGDVNLHPIVRNVISAAARIDTAKNVAEHFDVSQAQAHNLKHGKTTGTGEVRKEIIEESNKLVKGVHERAVEILMDSLNLITPEKLGELKAPALAGIAKDMGSVVEKTSPKADESKPTVVIITAPRRSLSDYETIEVEATIVK